MDPRTWKPMMIHKALYPKDDIDRLYVSGKEEERGLATTEDSINTSIRCLKDYIKKNKERQIMAIRNNTRISRTTINRKQKWEEKQLFGHFKRQTRKISLNKTWTWLRKGNIKRGTESLLIAAQNNAMKINYIKEKTDKKQLNSKCRLWDKMINYIISEWSKLVQKDETQLGGESNPREVGICCMSNQPDECSTKPFLRWVLAQGCSSDTPSIPKNALGPVSISLKKSPSGTRW